MRRIKKVFSIIHFVLWILFTLLVGLQLSQGKDAYWLIVTAGFVLANLYIFYSHFYLLTRYLGKNKKGAYLIRLAVISITGPIIFVLSHYTKPDFEHVILDYYRMALVTMVPAFLFLSWLARITENLVLNTFRKEELEKFALETELNYLKSQINPHFLFNTLHNIHTLVYKQAATAPEAVLRLASLMRYMIYESNVPLVRLDREVHYLQDHISLQQLRYKSSDVVDLKITGATHTYHIAPLLFIDFIENAFKHSPANLSPGDIKVRLEIEEDTLSFEVSNPVVALHTTALESPGGIGLTNVKKRLALLYPDKHTLAIISTEGAFTIKLIVSGLKTPVHENTTDLLYH